MLPPHLCSRVRPRGPCSLQQQQPMMQECGETSRIDKRWWEDAIDMLSTSKYS